MSKKRPSKMPSWVLPVVIAFIGLIGAFGAPFITCYLEDSCNYAAEPDPTAPPPTTPPPTSTPPSPLLPPPAIDYLPNRGEIKWNLRFIQGGTNTNAEIAEGLSQVGWGDADEILHLLTDEFERTTSFSHYYQARDICQPHSDIHAILTQVILMKTAEGAVKYLDWMQTNPNKAETYPLMDVGDKAYISWLQSTSPCEMIDLYLEFQKYNAIFNLQISFNEDLISRAEVKAIGLHLAEVIELKLDAAAQE